MHFWLIGTGASAVAALTETMHPDGSGRVAVTVAARVWRRSVSPVLFGVLLDATNPTGHPPTLWGWAFAVFGIGGVVGDGLRWRLPRASSLPTFPAICGCGVAAK